MEIVRGATAASMPRTFVYFAREHQPDARGPIKIGFSTSPARRLATLQTGNPRRVDIVEVIYGDFELEATLHRIWRRAGATWTGGGGEWFDGAWGAAILAQGEEIAARQLQALRGPRPTAAQLDQITNDVLHIRKPVMWHEQIRRAS